MCVIITWLQDTNKILPSIHEMWPFRVCSFILHEERLWSARIISVTMNTNSDRFSWQRNFSDFYFCIIILSVVCSYVYFEFIILSKWRQFMAELLWLNEGYTVTQSESTEEYFCKTTAIWNILGNDGEQRNDDTPVVDWDMSSFTVKTDIIQVDHMTNFYSHLSCLQTLKI